jgi:hypothetical protein
LSALKAGSLLLAFATLAVGFDAQARCRSLSMEQRGAEYAVAAADQVFVGRLLRVWEQPPPERPPSCRGDPCLEYVQVTSGPMPSPWLGEFRVQKHYKGEPARRLVVRIRDGLRPRQRYLVYAYQGDGELVAAGGCEGRAFAVGDQTEKHLAYLDSLPAPGSGGFVDLALLHANGTMQPGQSLLFEGAEGSFELVTGTDHWTRSVAWPAGRYRLQTPPPAGYRYLCGSGDCDALMVQDRMVSWWRIQLEALARVRIELRDSDGALVDVEAEFEWLDAELGTPVDFARAQVDRNDQRMSIGGRLPPGRLVPALVISEVVELERGSRVTQRRRWYSGGVAFEEAPVHELQAGDHVVEFVLPDALRPVTVDVRHHGLDPTYGWQWVERSLRGWVEPDRSPAGRGHSHTCRELDAGPCQQVFQAIPGQTWSLSSLRHQVQATGAREWSSQITASEQVDLYWQVDE